ncbi:MAG: hypothetical protein P8174_08675 [Gemmatimonadota bacterium]
MTTSRIAALLTALAATACASKAPERRIVAERWDTLGLITPRSVQDTTLLEVHDVVPWNGNYAVVDGNDRSIRYVTKRGKLIWTFRRIGSGPGELRSIYRTGVGPDGRLWVYDGRNAKLLELDDGGAVVRDRSLHHLPVTPANFAFLGDRLVVQTLSPDPFLLVLDTTTLAVVRAVPWPWSQPVTPDVDFNTSMAAGGGAVVAALHRGPGFLVLKADGGMELHRYVVDIPWQYKYSPQRRAARRDSTWLAAVAVTVDSGHIYMLFGGRPRMASHPWVEPTRLIDVYDVGGAYLRSYRLPSHFKKMTRDDDGAFVLWNESEEGLPQIWRFRPVAR